MPIEYVVLNQGALVLEVWTGTVSHAELLAHEQRHLSDSSIAHGASVHADATASSAENLRDFPSSLGTIRMIHDHCCGSRGSAPLGE